MKTAAAFFRRETVFCIALLLALLSMLATPPNAGYLAYIDARVMILLFCLMAVVAGLKESGLLRRASDALLRRTGSLRALGMALTGLCFFSSMLVTNDVALITFVPLTLAVLAEQDPRRVITVVVLETVAANLGSMATPVGNPQNLFLYAFYDMTAADFLKTVLPIAGISLVMLGACCMFLPATPVPPPSSDANRPLDRKRTAVYLALFVVCLLTVFKALPAPWCLGVVFVVMLFVSPHALRRVDYFLLGTFAAFFVFVGNVSALEPVRGFLRERLAGRALLYGALLSQIISNVPAALMLAPFTDEARALLAGVNIGGLGTLVASLASLISFRLYARDPRADKTRYIVRFTAYNAVFLALLLAAAYIMEGNGWA